MDHSVKRTSVQATCPCLPHCMHKLTLKLGKQLCNLLSPMLHTTHPGIGGALIHVPPFEGSERTSLNDVVGLSRRYTCSAEGVGSAYKNLLPNENWFVEQCYGYTRQAAIVSAFLNIHEKVRRKQKCGNVDRLVFTAWNAIMVFWQWRIAWESDVVFQGKAIDSEKQSVHLSRASPRNYHPPLSGGPATLSKSCLVLHSFYLRVCQFFCFHPLTRQEDIRFHYDESESLHLLDPFFKLFPEIHYRRPLVNAP